MDNNKKESNPSLTLVANRLSQYLGLLFVPAAIGPHGMGTTRAFSINTEAGTYGSLAMEINRITGSIAIPAVYKSLIGLSLGKLTQSCKKMKNPMISWS